MVSPVNFMSLKGAHRLLLNKRKIDDYQVTYPSLDAVLEQVKAMLLNHGAEWDKINYKLTETEKKSQRRLQNLWLIKAKIKNIKDITNYLYRK